MIGAVARRVGWRGEVARDGRVARCWHTGGINHACLGMRDTPLCLPHVLGFQLAARVAVMVEVEMAVVVTHATWRGVL